jgi:hypothetical protein
MTTNGQPALSPGKGAVDTDTTAGRWRGGRGRRPMAIKADPSARPPRRRGPGARLITVLIIAIVAVVVTLVLVLAVGPLVVHSPATPH